MIPEDIRIEDLQRFSANTLVEHLGIEFTSVTANQLSARMPVDERTIQPHGLLHGGASVALAETLGSVGASLILPKGQVPVGLEINANHVKSAKSGFVHGTASPIHIGKKTHIWSIEIKNDDNQLVCISRITLAILDK